jgi:flagellar motor switch protein FliG
MNLNDIRANAYKSSTHSDDTKSSGTVKPSAQKPFTGVNREVDDIFTHSRKLSKQSASQPGNSALDKAAEALKDGGLLKVPVEQAKPGEKESVYRRVAKFLLIIGVDEAAKVMQHLTEEQTEKIIPEIASIRSVSPDEATAILQEFQGLIQQARDSGGIDTAREILEKAYGSKKAQELLEHASPFPEGKPFDFLNDSDNEKIFLLLKDESAAVRALVLSRIEPKKAAAVINQMDAADKKDVIQRLAKMQPVSPEVLRRMDKAMHEKALAMTTEKAEVVDGRNALAEILKKMSPESGEEILDTLAESDPDLGRELKDRLFTIDDVDNTDDRYIQEQLRPMSDTDIAYLIAGKPDAFRSKILRNVSSGRSAQILDEEQIRKPMLRRDCAEMTDRFLSALRTAFEQGKFRVGGRNENEYVQ